MVLEWRPSLGVHTISVCNQPSRPTQPPILCGTGNEYRSKCDDALRLRVKAVWLIPFVDKRACAWKVKLWDPILRKGAIQMSCVQLLLFFKRQNFQCVIVIHWRSLETRLLSREVSRRGLPCLGLGSVSTLQCPVFATPHDRVRYSFFHHQHQLERTFVRARISDNLLAKCNRHLTCHCMTVMCHGTCNLDNVSVSEKNVSAHTLLSYVCYLCDYHKKFARHIMNRRCIKSFITILITLIYKILSASTFYR